MNGKTPISALQELMAARQLALPIYVEEGIDTRFKCTVHAAGITAVGYGSNKKGAKHESAKHALEKLATMTKAPTILILEKSSPIQVQPFRNYVGDLNEFASKRGLSYADYQNVTVTVTGEFYIKCIFMGKETLGRGSNKKDAKQHAAMEMLTLVTAMEPEVLISGVKRKPTIEEFGQRDTVMKVFETLSVNDSSTVYMTKTNDLKAIPNIQIVSNASVEELKEKLRLHGVEYNLKELQRRPSIVFAHIKGTDLHFAGNGSTREEATRQALLDALEAAKSGVSLSTNDLISL